MLLKIYPAARRALTDIWHYTAGEWGEKKADTYIRGLYSAIEKAAYNRVLWRTVEHQQNIRNVFFIRYKSHYIFFRELSSETLGVISVLHDRMNIPSRLREDIDDEF